MRLNMVCHNVEKRTYIAAYKEDSKVGKQIEDAQKVATQRWTYGTRISFYIQKLAKKADLQ